MKIKGFGFRFGGLEDTDSRLTSFAIVASYCFSNLILKSDSSPKMNLDSFAKIWNKYILCNYISPEKGVKIV